MIHTVKQPFMCRKDQFKSVGFPGQQLVVGITVSALNAHNPYQFKIGKSPTIYSADSKEALQIAHYWTNRSGVQVAIIPVNFFKVEKGVKTSEVRQSSSQLIFDKMTTPELITTPHPGVRLLNEG